MKKMVSILLATGITLTLTACGEAANGMITRTTVSTRTTTSVVSSTTTATTDLSADQMTDVTIFEADVTTTMDTAAAESTTAATEMATTTTQESTAAETTTTVTTTKKPTTVATTTTTATTTTKKPTTTQTTTTTKKPTTTTTTTQPTASPDLDVEIHELETYMLELLNADRAALGLQPLKMSLYLHECAEIRAQEASEYFSHTRPNGEHWYTVFEECGKDFGSRAGENIGTGFSYGREGVERIYQALYESEGHRANMMKPQFTEVAIAIYWSTSEEWADRQIGTVTQLFNG